MELVIESEVCNYSKDEREGVVYFLTCEETGDSCEYFDEVNTLQWISPYTGKLHVNEKEIKTVEEAIEVFRSWISK